MSRRPDLLSTRESISTAQVAVSLASVREVPGLSVSGDPLSCPEPIDDPFYGRQLRDQRMPARPSRGDDVVPVPFSRRP